MFMAKSKTIQKRVSKNYNITQDALKVIEAFKKLAPENERKVSDFVVDAIIHYGAVVLGDKMPKLSEEAPSHLNKSFDDIQKELNRLRRRIIETEHDEDNITEMLNLLKKHGIASEDNLRKAPKKVRNELKEYLKSSKDWVSFIEWKRTELGGE